MGGCDYNMKKKHLFLTLGILVTLIGIVLCLLFAFLGVYGKMQSNTEARDHATASDTIVSYLKDSWYFQDGQWDKPSNTVTAIRTYDLTYEEGKKVGAAVFTDDLAPESYLSQAITIAADLNSRFSTEDITVVISFRSSDGLELFSVDSIGNISTCWDTEN